MNFNPLHAFLSLPAMIAPQQLGHGLRLRRQTASQSSAIALSVTLTIHATLEIEYPSQGFIRLANTDETLLQLRDLIK